MIEMLLYWLAIPATCTFMLWMYALARIGTPPSSLSDEMKKRLMLICIVYPIGICVWIKQFIVDNKDE